MQLRKNQSGFSHIELLLVVIIVALIGAVGWFVYDRNKAKDSSTNTPATKEITNFDECAAAGNQIMESYPAQCRANNKVFTQDISKEQEGQSNNSSQSGSEYLEIKELGVKFQLNDSISQAYYYIGNNGKTAYFSLQKFKGTECAADKTSQAALTKYNEDEISSDPEVEVGTADLKKIGEHYYHISRGQAPCGGDEATQLAGIDMATSIIKSLGTTLQQL